MKAKNLKPIGTLTAALLLTLLLGCGPAKTPETETKEAGAPPATTPAAPAATDATAAAVPDPTPVTAAPATGTIRYLASSTGSKMRMEGTSSMHDWHMESTIVGGFLEADAGFPATSTKAMAQVFSPVRSFKSSSGKKMDEKMQEHMKAAQFKNIDYRLIELKPKGAAGATGPVPFDAIGALTITGNTVTNTMSVTIEKTADGKLKVVGATPLKMTDFKLPPPEIKLATISLISVGDDLKINFEWLLAPQAQ